jgi:hypothetical protein
MIRGVIYGLILLVVAVTVFLYAGQRGGLRAGHQRIPTQSEHQLERRF